MCRTAVFAPGMVLAACLFTSPLSAQELPPMARWLPPDAAVVLEVSQPLALVEPLLSPEVAGVANSLTEGHKADPKLQQLQGVVAYLELELGTNWRTGLRQLLGQGVSLAIDPGGGVILCSDGRDEKLLQQLHEVVRKFAAGEAAKQGDPARVASHEYKGATVWTLGPNEAHALLGPRLLVANQRAFLERVLDGRSSSTDERLAASKRYQAAMQALGPDTVATVFLDLKTLRQNPKIQEALSADANPLGTLLLCEAKEALRNAGWLAAGLRVRNRQLTLKLVTDGQASAESKAAAFAAPDAGEGALPPLEVAGGIAQASLFRDLQKFYTAKDDLFAERTSGLIFFENMMGIFFSGTELTTGVLGETRPEVRLVVAEQHYDPVVGTPAIQVPSFAMVMRLRHPQPFGETVEEAWQKALGLVNFTRGQKALPGLVIDRATHHDVKYTFSYYRPPTDKDKERAPIDDRYNYRPSLARVGDSIILSSTDELARDLIDALQRESATPPKPAAAHTLVQIDGPRLRAILLANREHLVQKNMLEKGHSREQAENDLRGLLFVLDCIERVDLSMAREERRPTATLDLKLQLPTAKPAPAKATQSKS